MRSRVERAEEAAFDYQRELGIIDSVSDEHIIARRMGFYDGYKKAEKDTIERAVAWLKKNTKNYVGQVQEPFWFMFIQHFKKAMEEE